MSEHTWEEEWELITPRRGVNSMREAEFGTTDPIICNKKERERD
jgi:hypothetical protein